MTLTDLIDVFFIAASPFSQLAMAIPLGIEVYDMPWQVVFPVAVAGNLLAVPFLYTIIDPGYRLVSRVSALQFVIRFADWVFERCRRRGGIVEKYGGVGLVLWVGIPLPMTGVWTGTVIAWLLGLSFRRTFPCTALGSLMAATIVTTLTLMGWGVATICGICLILLAFFGLRRIL